MPITTPEIKVDSVAGLGANVVLEGDSYDDAYAEAMRIARRRRLTFVHPYDDPDVIAGQGTSAWRSCASFGADRRDLRRGRRRRSHRRHRRVRQAPAPRDPDRGGRAGGRERDGALPPRRPSRHPPHVGLFADGVAVKQVGVETFRLARLYVDEMILVDTDELCAAMKEVFEDTRAIVEPSAALGVAGAKRYVAARGISGRNLVTSSAAPT
jgi:threonine dehydratase